MRVFSLFFIMFFVACQSHIDSSYSVSYSETDDNNNDGTNNTDEDEPGTPELYSLVEVGGVNISSTWQRVNFTNKIRNSVLVVGPMTMNDSVPSSVRIRNLSETGFELRLYDQTAVAGHTERVSWIAVAKGKHTLLDGTIIEAGSIETDAVSKAGNSETISFQSTYLNRPVVYSTSNTFNNDIYLSSRLFAVDTTGFELANDPLETLTANLPNSEQIAWVAILPQGDTLNKYTISSDDNGGDMTEALRTFSFSYSIADMEIFAQTQTINGGDPVITRINAINSNDITIKLLEDTSKDSEQNHGGAEQVIVILLKNGVLLTE